MKFNGVLLKESLKDDAILSILVITKEEQWDVDNATEDQPKQWTAVYYEGKEEDADEIAKKLGESLKKGQWYTNFSASSKEFIIFPGKVFIYEKGDSNSATLAKEHGRSIGIPESQLDWDKEASAIP